MIEVMNLCEITSNHVNIYINNVVSLVLFIKKWPNCIITPWGFDFTI